MTGTIFGLNGWGLGPLLKSTSVTHEDWVNILANVLKKKTEIKHQDSIMSKTENNERFGVKH